MRRLGFKIPCFQAKFKNAIPAIDSHLTKKKPRNFAKYLPFYYRHFENIRRSSR
jgi:hypothetical protein